MKGAKSTQKISFKNHVLQEKLKCLEEWQVQMVYTCMRNRDNVEISKYVGRSEMNLGITIYCLGVCLYLHCMFYQQINIQ